MITFRVLGTWFLNTVSTTTTLIIIVQNNTGQLRKKQHTNKYVQNGIARMANWNSICLSKGQQCKEVNVITVKSQMA